MKFNLVYLSAYPQMDVSLQIPAISGILITLSTVIARLEYFQPRHGGFRWAQQLKQTCACEILHVRLEEYLKLGALLLNLDRSEGKKVPAKETNRLARDINTWACGRGVFAPNPINVRLFLS